MATPGASESQTGRRSMAERKGAIAWMAKNPVAANLLMLLLLVGGLIMGFRVRQEVFPETDLDIIAVSVPYPGASPSEVESGIILAVEEAVRGLDGVKRVTSQATEGMASVNVELLIDVDKSKALSDVKGAVDRLTSLPKDSERPTTSLLDTRKEVISVVLYGEQDAKVLRALAERARDQMLSDPGITQVDLLGAPAKEIAIEVPTAQLRTHNLTLEAVAQKVAATAVELPGGGVKTSSGEVLVRTAERRESDDEFSDIPLVNGPRGAEVRLGELADVRETFAETDESAVFEGKPAIMLRVYRTGEQTPIEVADTVREHIEQIKSWLPAGVEVAQWADWSEIYRERMELLMRNAQMGLILVLLSLGLFLELRLAFWVTMGIPISFLGALLFMPSMDVSVNMISMFAFIVTLGMVVDDAIVVGENIYTFRQRGMSHVDAAVHGVSQVATPVTFSIATTVAAFSPMLFVPGFMGKLFAVIPMIVISVLVISLVESLFVLPAHLGHQKDARPGGVFHWIGERQQVVSRALERFIERRYAPVLKATLRRRYFALAVGVSSIIITAGIVAGGRISFHFMPQLDGDIVVAQVELPYGSSVEQTERVRARMESAAKRALEDFGGDEAKRGVFSQVGALFAAGGPRPAGAASGGHLANVQVFLTPSDEREFESREFLERWRELTGPVFEARKLTFSASMGPSAGSPVDVELNHPDADVLEAAAAEVEQALEGYAGVRDIENGNAEGKPQLDLTLTPAATSLGLTSNDVARQVRSAFYGAEALRQQEGRNEVRIIARLPVQERRSEFDIESMLIRTPDGGEVPLMVVAEVERGRSWPQIERADGGRIIHVKADIDDKVTAANIVLETLTKDVLKDLPGRYPGLTYAFGGETREQAETMGSLKTGGLIALIVIYALLAIPFRSYAQPLIVMSAIPFGMVGAVFGHLLMGYSLSMVSMMGLVALTGVVVNDSLVLIDAANHYRREGYGALQAILAAGVRRFRPILLTSITTFLGLMPMILETSVQARFLIPMAISLGFGVLFATFIILLLVPALYMMLEDLLWTRRVIGRWLLGDPARATALAEEPYEDGFEEDFDVDFDDVY